MSATAAALCLILGAKTVGLAADRFTLAWTHSVEHTDWQEDYVLRGGSLVLTEARIEGTGAGMEPPPNAVLRAGWWHYVPDLQPLSELRLTLSPFTADYRFCWSGQCRPLAALVGAQTPQGIVIVHACVRPTGTARTTIK